MFTNGMLIEPYIETIAKSLSTITFSLDGVGKVNDEIRLGCNYQKVIQNIRKLRHIREQLHAGIQIKVNCTKTTQTDIELDEFLTEMKDLADIVRIGMVRNTENRLDNTMSNGNIFCSNPFRILVLLWNGNVSYCQCSGPFPPVVGNIYENSLREIWTSQTMRNARVEAVKFGTPQCKLCENCDVWRRESTLKIWSNQENWSW